MDIHQQKSTRKKGVGLRYQSTASEVVWLRQGALADFHGEPLSTICWWFKQEIRWFIYMVYMGIHGIICGLYGNTWRLYGDYMVIILWLYGNIWDYMGSCGWLRKTCTRQGNYNYRQLWNAVNNGFVHGRSHLPNVAGFRNHPLWWGNDDKPSTLGLLYF